MTSRERVLTALRHQEPDRVPIDFGGTDVSTIMVGPYCRTCRALGLDPGPIRMSNPVGQRVAVGEELNRAFHGDTLLLPKLPRQWREGSAYDGSPVLYPDRFRPRERADGSKALVDAQGRDYYVMPRGGFFFDRVVHPLEGISDPSQIDRAKADIDSFDRPGYWDLPLDEVAQEAERLRRTTDKLLVGGFIGHIFQAAQYLRGWDRFMMDLLGHPALAEAILERLAEAHIRAFDHYNAHLGKYLDVVVICDDLGMQSALWMSPELYRKRVKPFQARLYRHIKSTWDGFLLLHSDGSIRPIIGDLIEIGVDILNPVQFSARDMDLAGLKKEFGREVTFWGGGFNTQTTLPFGSAREVAEEVRRNLEIMAPGGGYVFASVHNITEGAPAENIIAAYQTAYEAGKY